MDNMRQKIAEALMQRQQNPMSAYAGDKATHYGVTAGLNAATAGVALPGGLAMTPEVPWLGIPMAAYGAMNAKDAYDNWQMRQRMLEGEQMWGNTGMPGRPDGQ